jgi:hypothetical protein
MNQSLLIIFIFLTNLCTMKAQDGIRVQRLKEDSTQLNKMVLALTVKEKGTTERIFAYDNLKAKFPDFTKIAGKDFDNDLLERLLNVWNEKYAFAIGRQRLKDKSIGFMVNLKDEYLNQGFTIAQANSLVLEKAIIPSCTKNNQEPKKIIGCVSEDLNFYLEDLGIFSQTEIDNLVHLIEDKLEKEYYPKPKSQQPKKPTTKKQN